MATDEITPAQARRAGLLRQRLIKFLGDQGFIIIFILWGLFLTLATDAFATPHNAFTILRQASIIGVMAIAAHIIILLGDMDLSVAATMSLCGVIMAVLMVSYDLHPILAALIVLLFGGLIGSINGLIITGIGINAIIATLGTSSILLGLAFLITGGKTVFGDQIDSIEFLARGRLLGSIPVSVIIMFTLYILAFLMLRYTIFGAQLYASGNNKKASWLAGVNVNRVKVSAFVLAGTLTSVAGIMQVARQGTATAGMGTDFLFPVLTAVVLGGASLQGGRGKIFNTLIAAIFLTTITNGMILLGISIYGQRIVSGAILILALSLDRLRTVRV